MTEIPPMVPSAEDRANTILAHFRNRFHDEPVVLGQAINDAYREGFTAGVQAERQAIDRDQINYDEGRQFERAAIIAMLREPDERMREIAYNLIADRHGTATVLRALADHLESQTK